ncbi:MAG: DUF3179 domain-containing protein [Myxococcota bacterium]
MRAGVAAAFRALLVAALLASAGAAAAETPTLNGFRLDPRGIDVREILPGGPGRDGIPALDHPPAVAAGDSPWPADAAVLGVVRNGEARAYPIAILVWHELVNDTLGGSPILVSYCPLCGTGIVFDRRRGGSDRSFGVSGLLYRSDLLLYDRESESLWSQILGEAVTGPSQGQRLAQVRSRMTTWGRWREAHPASSVLSRDTGHSRSYGATPYGDYETSERILFPVPRDRRYHPKTPTVGLRVPGGAARAYPAPELERAGGVVQESFAGQPVRVAYDPELRRFEVEAPASVEVVEGFWFAWASFHPDTSVYTAVEEHP